MVIYPKLPLFLPQNSFLRSTCLTSSILHSSSLSNLKSEILCVWRRKYFKLLSRSIFYPFMESFYSSRSMNCWAGRQAFGTQLWVFSYPELKYILIGYVMQKTSPATLRVPIVLQQIIHLSTQKKKPPSTNPIVLLIIKLFTNCKQKEQDKAYTHHHQVRPWESLW